MRLQFNKTKQSQKLLCLECKSFSIPNLQEATKEELFEKRFTEKAIYGKPAKKRF